MTIFKRLKNLWLLSESSFLEGLAEQEIKEKIDEELLKAYPPISRKTYGFQYPDGKEAPQFIKRPVKTIDEEIKEILQNDNSTTQ